MNDVMKILIVDDDKTLRNTLSERLALVPKFKTEQAETGKEGLEKARAIPFDVILLDVALPDFDGREVCRLMRKAGVTCPIIMLTGQDSDADTIYGLDAGADDYVTKPFRMTTLLARIRAHTRIHERSEDTVLQIGRYTFTPAKKLLEDTDQKKVRLTAKEAAILKYLYNMESRVASRDTLLEEIWGYSSTVVDTHTLDTHIYRLRQKIEHDPSNAQLLVTESPGYRLVA